MLEPDWLLLLLRIRTLVRMDGMPCVPFLFDTCKCAGRLAPFVTCSVIVSVMTIMDVRVVLLLTLTVSIAKAVLLRENVVFKKRSVNVTCYLWYCTLCC